MKESSQSLPYKDRIRSWARTEAHGGSHRSARRPITDPQHPSPTPLSSPGSSPPSATSPSTIPHGDTDHGAVRPSSSRGSRSGEVGGVGSISSTVAGAGDGNAASAASPQAAGPRSVVEPAAADKDATKTNIFLRFLLAAKTILLWSKLNLLLVLVPVGIAVHVRDMQPGLVFAMNAIAIVPLAGLLSYATEVVARRLGDAIGALLNITFGNAVELIIFIIALTKNEIRIVQASLLGSILSNLLLILGMSFLLGGLRFREQIYNSTITQMSACLLSLSVISLVLPTAFHASFSNADLADAQSIKISRGTSVVLLLVYAIYLLFQLKSHAYMYESTPQHIIDEEATPGPVAVWLESDSDDGSSSASDSDGSGHSKDTVSKRVKRVIRAGRKRKASIVSTATSDAPPTRTSSFGTADTHRANDGTPTEDSTSRPWLVPRPSTLEGTDEAVEDDHAHGSGGRGNRRSSRRHRKHKNRAVNPAPHDPGLLGDHRMDEDAEASDKVKFAGDTRRVDFALSDTTSQEAGITEVVATKLPFTGLRNMSLLPVAKSLTPTVFAQPPEVANPAAPAGPVPRVRYGIRRTNSLPDRLSQYYRAPGAMMPSQIPVTSLPSGDKASSGGAEGHGDDMSRTSAIILLLVSTGLVAVCADFMVDSINGLVATSSVSELFIGLIILPIVGNAAEHVTAITVAMKNKMDLSIGVAVGSSIQIALFITPLVVILGWIMNREMDLYFTLFETVCLFVSAFIVNFLVLDGRSNYLEGALLCATYIIIGVVAFYYPDAKNTSAWGK